MEFIAKKSTSNGGSPGDWGVGRHATGGGSPRDYKEEPYQEEDILHPIIIPREEKRKEEEFSDEKGKKGARFREYKGVKLPTEQFEELIKIRGSKEEVKRVIDDIKLKHTKTIKYWFETIKNWTIDSPPPIKGLLNDNPLDMNTIDPFILNHLKKQEKNYE